MTDFRISRELAQRSASGHLHPYAASSAISCRAPTAAIPAIVKRGPDPKRTLDTGSAGLAIGGAYLAVAAGVDHLVAEFGVAR
jgi:hypothetical protein